MSVDLFTFVGMFSRQMDVAQHLLTKGAAHAETLGETGEDMLTWRLVEDMLPVSFQVMLVCNTARWWPARAAGLAELESAPMSLTLDGFHAALAETKAWLGTLTPGQFAGRDDVVMTYDISPTDKATLTAAQWITGFATTNLYFHQSTLYGILRARGAKVGKFDLFPGGL